MTWPARPLRSSLITRPSSLLRAGPSLCLASVLCHSRLFPLAVLPLNDQRANITRFDWPPVSRRQVLLFPTSACDELTPPIHRTPPGPQTGSSLAEGTPTRALLCPGTCEPPGFGVINKPFDASAVVHTCSSSRRLPDPLVAGRFRSRFPPRLLTDMTLRWFEISACTATPEDLPPSHIEHVLFWRSSTSSSLHFQDTPRTRLTDVVHRRHSVSLARPGRAWVR